MMDISESYEERMGAQFAKADEAIREKQARHVSRLRWEYAARQVRNEKADISAMRGCPLPVDLLAALQAYEALSREYDQGDPASVRTFGTVLSEVESEVER